MSFIDDIQGQNTQLYPIVTIEPPDTAEGGNGWITDLNRCMFLSTNNVSLDHIHSIYYEGIGSGTLPDTKQLNFKPLLLNIPSIKESIDIESRKFKISNVSLDISNLEYEGKRFTDILSDTSLINWKVSIQFVSPSANKFSTIFGLSTQYNWNSESMYQAWSGTGNTTFAHLETDSSGNVAYHSKMTQMVYQGIIRRISHDDTKCKIELEDLTEKLAHKNLPQAIDQNGVVGVLGAGDGIPDKYKNKPIPMVYGKVDRSPLVIGENYRKFIADSKDLKGEVTISSDEFGQKQSSLYIDTDNNYVNVEELDPDAGSQFTFGGNYFALSASNKNIYPQEDADSFIRVLDKNRDFSLQIAQPSDPLLSNSDFIDEDKLNAMTNGDASTLNDIELTASRQLHIDDYLGGDNIELLLLRMSINYAPNYGFIGADVRGLILNGNNVSESITNSNYFNTHYTPIFSEDVAHYTENAFSDQVGGLSDDYWENDPNLTSGNVQENDKWDSIISFTDAGNANPNPTNTGADLHFSCTLWKTGYLSGNFVKDADLLLINSENSYQTLIFDFRTLTTATVTFASGLYVNWDFTLTGNLNEIYLLRAVELLKPLSKDYYANLKGRTQTFDDHPDHDMQYIEGHMETVIHLEGTAFEYETSAWVHGIDPLIENPIDIIYDLVRREIGHDAIDEAEYEEAKAAHDGWKFGFTVNKKINSKKLIEEIAKSTKCFPKFKNDGTFGFNSIKDSYTVTDADGNGDYENAHLIKESEVISYSFKKTKPEQIYKKITVSYNKDYAQDSHLKTSLSEDLGDDPYYGIENSADAHLEFESDYIRHSADDGETANKLASFLSKQYKNDHLLFNLKLPLQYINLEIGDLVKFRDLFQGVKAYGIDYRIIQNPTSYESDTNDPASWGQYYYPLFMVTSTQKNLDSVSIECMQLHHLTGGSQEENAAWLDFSEDGDFYFPDSDPIIFAETFEEGAVVDEVVLAGETDQIEVPSGYYYVRQNEYYGHYNYSDLVFHKQNGVLLFDFELYPILNVGELIKINDENNNPFYYEILQVNQNNEESWLVLYPYDVQNQGVLTPLTAILSEYDGDLLITGASWQEVYPLGDANLDGGFDILDVVTIINHIQGQTLTGQAFINADINQSGNIDILDVVGVVQELIN